MIRVIACYVLHYGLEWLEWSMRSVAPCVDAIGLFYSPYPSFGHATNLVCPESEDQLIEAASRLPESANVSWFNAPRRFAHEGEHRTWAVNECYKMGADLVVVVDADELWAPDVLATAIHEAATTPNTDYRVGMRHFWRSVRYVCDDEAMPTRIIKRAPGQPRSDGYITEAGKVYHMGYAQSSAIIEYKQAIHGHKGEWREGWFENIFLPWKPGQGDVHPTCLNYWYPKRLDDGELLGLISDHPYARLDIIP